MRRVLVGLTLVAALTTGCEDDPSAPDGGDKLTIPVGQAEIADDAEIEASGSVLTVDGKSIDVGRTIDGYVPTATGVYVVSDGEIWMTDLEQTEPTDLSTVESENLNSSADGRYLGLIDFRHGPEDNFGTPLAATAVFDAATGELVVYDDTGMGTTGSEDDLEVLYSELEPHFYGFDDAAAYANTPDGIYRYPLDSGQAEEWLTDEEWPDNEAPPVAERWKDAADQS